MNNTKPEPLRSKLLWVVLPILLGVGPALYITSIQAQLQREQMILDRKITAIKEFSTVSWRGPAERATRFIELQSRVRGILDDTSPASIEHERFVTDYVSLISSFSQWGSEQASQAVITTALIRVEAPRYPKVEISFPRWEGFRRATPQQQRVGLERMRDTLELLSKNDIEFNLAMQGYVTKAAEALPLPTH